MAQQSGASSGAPAKPAAGTPKKLTWSERQALAKKQQEDDEKTNPSDEEHEVDGKLDGEIPLKDLIEVWKKTLKPMKQQCIEMKNNEYQLFMY